jgi:hypothetical protein
VSPARWRWRRSCSGGGGGATSAFWSGSGGGGKGREIGGVEEAERLGGGGTAAARWRRRNDGGAGQASACGAEGNGLPLSARGGQLTRFSLLSKSQRTFSISLFLPSSV